MCKDTGFLDYKRCGNLTVPPKDRIKNFDEFHTMLSVKDRREQGGRCMNCGVPFCQSGMVLSGMRTGCPLHNLIPEWNDEIYNGNWEHALSRLLKTNNFPEFTGRVCPALCECACTCGYNGEPVTVHDNELSIIEYGFEHNLINEKPPLVRTDKKVAVIGSGPSGLAVADQLNHRGHNVTVFERDDKAGGLLMYGIPNMKLDKKIVDRRIDLMKKQGVEFVTSFNVNSKTKAQKILSDFDAVVLCCGARKARNIFKTTPDINGIYYAVDFLTSTTKSLISSDLKDGTYISAKDKDVIIVGGGDTGNDCVGTSIRHGANSVTQLEMMPEPPTERLESNPWPEYPRVKKTDYGQQEAIEVFGSDPRVYSTTIKDVTADENGNLKSVITVMLESKVDEKTGKRVLAQVEGSEKELPAQLLLIAAGFIGCEDKTASCFGVDLSERNNIVTTNYMTNVDKVFAAGDAKNGQSLVVAAISDARACAKKVDHYLMGYTNMI
ncbi:MAG: glutamate synthase subunit beta [Faecalibacterium sp.]|nr:glutamate synthase subunit beta [Ruminococcus sp.]MCM1391945.1 glutamate synthase subunit beta [Ruminococcus sp.]MCM1484973.1 glutamate synthase subunit beta [Faecalibacterium sp.]